MSHIVAKSCLLFSHTVFKSLKKKSICPVFPLCVHLAKVSGVDLRDASHEQAVEAIRRAGDSVDFLVQSGQQRCQVLYFKEQPTQSTHSSFEALHVFPLNLTV